MNTKMKFQVGFLLGIICAWVIAATVGDKPTIEEWKKFEAWKRLHEEGANTATVITNARWFTADGKHPTNRVVCAPLKWVVRTNWISDQTVLRLDEMNALYGETGWVSSNLVANIEWKGRTHDVVLEERQFLMLSRKYWLETNRVYVKGETNQTRIHTITDTWTNQ